MLEETQLGVQAAAAAAAAGALQIWRFRRKCWVFDRSVVSEQLSIKRKKGTFAEWN